MHSSSDGLGLVFLVGLLMAGLSGLVDLRAADGSAAAQDPGHKSSRETLSISIDARIELLAVVQHFTSWADGGHIKSGTGYKDDIERYFADFREHRAVTLAENLVDAGFTHDAPVTFMLHHSDPPDLYLETPYSEYLVGRAGGEARLVEFRDVLREFARASDFMHFYDSQRPLYDTLAFEVKSLLAEKAYVRAIEDFFGESRDGYRLILSPLFAGGYGPTLCKEDGYEIYGVIGPCALKGTRTTFACLGYLESMMLHEWSHSFVNPLVDENMDAFGKSAHLFGPIRGMMKRQAYPDWRISLYEHIVRACEIHLRAGLYGDFEKEKSLAYHAGKGFWYIGQIDSLLEVYENARNEYTAFKAFMPVIASRLRGVSVSDLPAGVTRFTGPLDAIFPRTDRVYFVYPTAVGEETTREIREDLENLGRFLSAAGIDPVILNDKQALDMDWQDKVAFIYGSPDGNLFLDRIEMSIPLAFREGVIEFGGQRYEDDNILLITCLPNPFNETLPFALAVANSPDALLGAGLRMTGRSEWNVDYVIFKGDDQLESGRYRKDKATWSPTLE